MKKIALALSVACLGFAFVKDYNPSEKTEILNAAAQDDEPSTGAKGTSVSSVVTAAQALKASLSGTNLSSLQLTYSTALARKWSNLPCGASCRNGVQFGALTTAQLQLALNVIKEALGTTSVDGYAEFDANRIAEAYLHANGGSGYDSTLRWIAFLNEPSTTGAWMLQFGGHHYAANISFNKGQVIGATPFFQGLEPTSFTYASKSYAPLEDERTAFRNMLGSLSSTELTNAKLNQSFSDCVMIPGESNGGTSTFPAKAGIVCSTLTTAQKNYVLAAILRYVEDMDATTSAAIMATYTNEINSTYISWRGTGTAGSGTSFLATNGDYVRIDGPTVWIEFTCQNGVVVQGQIHYHTVWRDHSHDYGVDLTGAAIDGSTTNGVASVANTVGVTVYPNPATTSVQAMGRETLRDASIRIISLANGQTVQRVNGYNGIGVTADVAGLPSGMYMLRIDAGGAIYTGKFVKQ